MSTIETLPTETLGPPDETCRACGAPLVSDQRYCLECGERRGQARVPLTRGAPPPPMPPSAPAPAATGGPQHTSNAALLAGVGCLLLALLIGVLIGRAGRDSGGGGSPQVVTVGGTAAAGAATAAFKDDWPAGKKGYTIQLQTLPKDSTDAAKVAAAKSEASGKGAGAVGALDSDSHGSLDAGNYVIYSGAFASKAAATKALAGLKAKFPDASVVQVADSAGSADTSSGGGSGGSSKVTKKSSKAIQDLNSSSPEDYQKKSSKLPKQVTTPGKLPPKDDKKAGGGSDTESFG
jgi:hypothetical protein